MQRHQREYEEIKDKPYSKVKSKKIKDITRDIRELLSDLIFLTPDEIKEIADTEHYFDFVYLDTLVNIFPVLFETYIDAKRLREQLHTEGGYRIEGELAARMRKREISIEQDLQYGARSNIVTSNWLQRLFSRQDHIPTSEQGTNS